MTDTATLSPLEQIAALQAQLKELKSNAGQAMADDVTAKFTPLHDQVLSALAAIADGENPERASHALKWLGDNILDYRKLAKSYQKIVFGVVAPRKPRAVASDTAAIDEPVGNAPGKKAAKAAA